jgi:hypothetical protein
MRSDPGERHAAARTVRASHSERPSTASPTAGAVLGRSAGANYGLWGMRDSNARSQLVPQALASLGDRFGRPGERANGCGFMRPLIGSTGRPGWAG